MISEKNRKDMNIRFARSWASGFDPAFAVLFFETGGGDLELSFVGQLSGCKDPGLASPVRGAASAKLWSIEARAKEPRISGQTCIGRRRGYAQFS
jgi:hypothetical protein